MFKPLEVFLHNRSLARVAQDISRMIEHHELDARVVRVPEKFTGFRAHREIFLVVNNVFERRRAQQDNDLGLYNLKLFF